MDSKAASPSPLAQLRSRAVRGTYSREALKEIFKASPMAHCAYLHPGNGLAGPDGEERPRIINLPLLVVLREYASTSEDVDSAPNNGELVAYLHSYYGSRLVQAIKAGLDSLTISTTKIDGLVLGSTPRNHSVNYRSACIYGHMPYLVPNTPSGVAEKLVALEAVVNDVTGYDRTAFIGRTEETEAKKTAVIRVRIEDASCKQRIGGEEGDLPPTEDEGESATHGFTGVVPCWTQFGTARGIGQHREQLNAEMARQSEVGRQYAHDVAYARTKLDGR